MQIENRNVAATALIVACVALMSTGCTTFKLPSVSMLTQSPEAPALADPSVSGGTSSLDVYRKVREARGQNSIVLQVAGDDTLRVLPLPTDGRAVFVSTLVKQSGVQQKLGAIDITLYRFSKESVSGMPMDVRMNEARTVVRTESDYALQPGDRLAVKKVEMLALKQLLGGTLGL